MDKNNIDANLYSEKSLYLLNIRELRDMGRKFGVPSPTTMKKHDLVNYILKVVYGEIEPPIRNACGRPNSREFDMNKYIDKIKKNTDMTEQLKEARLNYSVTVPKMTFQLSAPKTTSYIGNIEQRVVFKHEDVCTLRVRQFIESDGDIKVPKQIEEKLKLENFDVVEIIRATNGLKIVSVNGKKVSTNIKPFTIKDEELIAGMRKVFYLRTKDDIEERITLISDECAKQNIKVIVFGLEKKLKGVESFELTEIDSEKQFKQFMIFIEYCKKLVYENEDIVIIINELNYIEDLIGGLEEDVSKRVKNHLYSDFEDFITLGNILLAFNKLKPLIY